jgi:glycogen debranching enzyme
VIAADDFVALPTPAPGAKSVATILAGFPWFADWGRDAFIALPGLLLATGRAELAHGVLRRFAGAIRNGLLPNRFSDEPFDPLEPFEPGRPGPDSDPDPGSDPGPAPGIGCDYNSVDAGLWFIRAAYAWAEHTGHFDDLHVELMTPIRSILDAYHHGTDYDIGVESDGLLACGSAATQLTWMDAMADGVAVTPRPGKPVEVNALYGHALRLTAERLRKRGDEEAGVYRARYEKWARSFVTRFVSPRGGLLDCIGPDGSPDEAIRPNQVIAASLPDSPLPIELRRDVVRIAAERLLTPFGLRSLAAGEPGYCGRCVGARAQRDGAYHQGTVWAWLIGPFIEAHLLVNEFSQDAKQQAASWLEPLLGHLDSAGLGQVSEIFDGDPPHAPRGCFAQAWSVAELLRSLAVIGSRSETAVAKAR